MSEEIAYDLPGFVNAFHVSRAKVFVEIKAGRLQSFNVGRRRLISKQAAEKWMHEREAEEATRRTQASDERTRRAENPEA